MSSTKEKTITGKQFNKKYNKAHNKCYKIMNQQLTHDGTTYNDGLNAHQECIFTFAEQNKIFNHFIEGNMIVPILIPEDAKVVVKQDVFKTDKIIIGLRNRTAMKDIPNWKDPDFCELLVSKHPFALSYVPTEPQTLPFLKKQMLKDVYLLSQIQNQTKELCEFAIKTDILALKYVRTQTKELCEFAVKRDKKAVEFIRDEELKTKTEIAHC